MQRSSRRTWFACSCWARPDRVGVRDTAACGAAIAENALGFGERSELLPLLVRSGAATGMNGIGAATGAECFLGGGRSSSKWLPSTRPNILRLASSGGVLRSSIRSLCADAVRPERRSIKALTSAIVPCPSTPDSFWRFWNSPLCDKTLIITVMIVGSGLCRAEAAAEAAAAVTTTAAVALRCFSRASCSCRSCWCCCSNACSCLCCSSCHDCPGGGGGHGFGGGG